MSDLFIFAGEASGDLLGAELLQALSKKDLKVVGVGGPKMRSLGFSCVAEMEEFRVMGFVDVFLALPHLLKKFFGIRRSILEINPKMVLFIDYPGFNLRMAKSLRSRGFEGKLCHFVCPSVWAWGKKRIPLMGKTLDLLLTLLPFEPALFEKTPLRAKYVGHPLVKRIDEHPYTPLDFPPSRRVIGIFPGSRKKEIVRNFPLFLRTAKRLLQESPDLLFAISLSHPSFEPLIREIAERAGLEKEAIRFIPAERNYDLMQSCTAAMAKSGTITLELALHAVPSVVCYAISTLDLFIAQKLLKINLPHYCLVNIIQGEEVFPELFGPHFTEEKLYTRFLSILSGEKACKEKCKMLRAKLSEKETMREAAALIEELL
jgi:lipid-A-disaccharide synthase